MTPRYELKYWADSAQVEQVLGDLRGLLARDAHCTEAAPAYTVTSLYLDTADLVYFWEKIEGVRERVKVRLRRYGSASDGFAELKLRKGARVRKERLHLDAEALKALAEGETAQLPRAPEAGRLLAELSRDLCPTVITRYEREAWVFSDDPTVRLTIDRSMRCWSRDAVATFFADDPGLEPMFEPPLEAPAVLEVKVLESVPRPVASALRRAGLIRRAISKYCLAVRRTRTLPVPLGHLLPAQPWASTRD